MIAIQKHCKIAIVSDSRITEKKNQSFLSHNYVSKFLKKSDCIVHINSSWEFQINKKSEKMPKSIKQKLNLKN